MCKIQCVQGSKVCAGIRVCAGIHVCAGVHAVFRCPWCMEVSIVYEEVSIFMYRRVLGLVSRAVRGVYSHIHAMCRYDLCMYGIHSMVRERFSHV